MAPTRTLVRASQTWPKTIRRRLGRDWGLAYALLAPAVVVLVGLIASPFISSIVLSFQSKTMGGEGHFVGLENFRALVTGPLFRVMAKNTILYTGVGVVAKTVLGVTIALILNQGMRFRNFFRSLVLLPWAAPVVVGAYTWRWILDGLSGLLNAVLLQVGLISRPIAWLGSMRLALWSVVAVMVWQGTPFYCLNFLAGLSSIDPSLYDAAAIDGAGPVQSFLHVTLPGLRSVMIITMLLSTIWTSNNLQFVFILTHGGPANATMTFPMKAFLTGILSGELGMGAATALCLIPFLLPVIIVLTKRLLSEEA